MLPLKGRHFIVIFNLMFVVFNFSGDFSFFFSQDLTAIGITKPAHRKRLKSEIARLNIHDGIPDFRPVSFLVFKAFYEVYIFLNIALYIIMHALRSSRGLCTGI